MEGLISQPRQSMENYPGDLWAVIVFGASGLPQLQMFTYSGPSFAYSTAPSAGSPAVYGPIKGLSVTRTGTGTYSFAFTNSDGSAAVLPRALEVTAVFGNSTGIPVVTDIGEVLSSGVSSTVSQGSLVLKTLGPSLSGSVGGLTAAAQTWTAGAYTPAGTNATSAVSPGAITPISGVPGSWGGTGNAVLTTTAIAALDNVAVNALAGGTISDGTTVGWIISNTLFNSSGVGTLTVRYDASHAYPSPFGVPSGTSNLTITPPAPLTAAAQVFTGSAASLTGTNGTSAVTGTITGLTSTLVATDPASGDVGIFRFGISQGR